MPTMTLTARNVAKLPPPERGRMEYFDKGVPGFGLRVTDKGARSWVVLYRHKGNQRRYTIGALSPSLGLADARTQAKAILRRAADGEDPAGDKKREREADTFRELAELYMTEYATPERRRAWKPQHNIIKKDLIPRFGARKACDVTRSDVRAMLKAIKDRGAPIQANRTLEVARKLFNWAIGEELGGVEHNPCDHIEKPARERRRERKLTDDEVRAIWSALPSIDPIIAGTYRLRFLTGVRGNEAMDMERPEIDGDWWTIPGNRTKNGRPHRVPLTSAALAVIAEMDKPSKGGRRIFPGRGKTGLKFAVYEPHDELMRASGVADWTPHDIRRTVASNLGSMGFSRFVIGRILNHVDATVTGVYDQHTYDAEKRQALAAWASRLEEILSGRPAASNIVPLPASVA